MIAKSDERLDRSDERFDRQHEELKIIGYELMNLSEDTKVLKEKQAGFHQNSLNKRRIFVQL